MNSSPVEQQNHNVLLKYQHKFFFFNLFYFTSCSLALIILMKECYTYLGIIIANFISTILFYTIDCTSIIFDDNYFREEKYKIILRIIQGINLFFNLVSTIYFFGKDKICYSEWDQNLNLNFYFFTLSVIILNQIFIKCYKRENQIVPEKNLKDISSLKGIIKTDTINECAICLEEKKTEVEIIVLDCTHIFHYICLNDCYQNDIKRCPMCRVEFL